MNYSDNEALIKLANRMVKKTNQINVLQDKYIGQYPPLITFIDELFKKSLKNKTLMLPELNKDGNGSTSIFSDYGGEAKDSNYLTYSFLVCGWNHSHGLEIEMKKIREKYGLGDKEISFKDFRFGPIKRALPDYLNALDNYVFGMLFTVIIDKKAGPFFNIRTEEGLSVSQHLKANNLGVWKPKVAEKLMRITHIAAYLTNLLAEEDQKLLWMTDSDAIASTSSQLNDLIKVFDRVLLLYGEKPYPLVGGAIPFKERSVKMLDLLSCADISAGSIEHYFTRKDKMNDSLTVKEEANSVLEWLSRDGIGLKKKTIIIQSAEEDGKVNYGEVEFQTINDSDDMQFIPIYM
ncbi:hypothetical protein MT391_14520 [Vibrio sp. 1-Bac 57]